MSGDISQLILALSSNKADVRADAAEQLGHLGDAAKSAAVPLVRATDDEDEQVSEWAVGALEELGPPAADDIPALAELLADEGTNVAYWSATLLGRLGENAERAAAQLAAALAGHRDLAVRQRAAWALGRIGPRAVTAKDVLAAASESDDPRLARLAAEALQRIVR